MPNDNLTFCSWPLSATIANWYDTPFLIQSPPERSRVMSIKIHFFSLLLIPLFLLGFNFVWIVSKVGKKANKPGFNKCPKTHEVNSKEIAQLWASLNKTVLTEN